MHIMKKWMWQLFLDWGILLRKQERKKLMLKIWWNSYFARLAPSKKRVEQCLVYGIEFFPQNFCWNGLKKLRFACGYCIQTHVVGQKRGKYLLNFLFCIAFYSLSTKLRMDVSLCSSSVYGIHAFHLLLFFPTNRPHLTFIALLEFLSTTSIFFLLNIVEITATVLPQIRYFGVRKIRTLQFSTSSKSQKN